MTLDNAAPRGRTDSARVVIAEDEQLAARHLERLVAESPGVTLVGTATDGRQAVEMVRSLRPDAVFLDVQLPVLDGLQVLSAIDYEPYVVFTTAYEAHAVTAFQLGALDYLLKPFTDERFHDAVARINKAMTSAPADPDPHAGAATSVAHRAGIVLRSEGYISRLFVRERDTVRPVLVAQIERAEADGDYTALIVAGRRRLAYISLNDLNASLDPTQFLRIHRSHLVNLDFVVDMQWYDGTRLQIQMRDGTKVLASRTRSRDLRKLIV